MPIRAWLLLFLVGCAARSPAAAPAAPAAPRAAVGQPIDADYAELLLYRQGAALLANAMNPEQLVFPVEVRVAGEAVGAMRGRDCIFVRVSPGPVTVARADGGGAITIVTEPRHRYELVGVARIGLFAPTVAWKTEEEARHAFSERSCRATSTVDLRGD